MNTALANNGGRLMFFSQTVPSVRHLAIALALIHRSYLNRHSNDQAYKPPPLKDRLPDKAPLLHYSRAIQLLPNQESGDRRKQLSPFWSAISLPALIIWRATTYRY